MSCGSCGCGSQSRANKIKLVAFMILTAGYFLVEIIVGNITNSMALVADAFHMLSDVVALVIAFISMVMSPKKWNKNTYGFARAEVLGALSNAVFLLALCFSIFVEALKKFIKPEEIDNPTLVLIVGATGLAINLIGLILFSGGGGGHGHSHGGGGGHGHSHGGQGHSHGGNDHRDSVVSTASTNGSITNGHVINRNGLNDVKSEKNGNFATSDSDNHEKKRNKGSHQMNIRGVFLHVLGDALGSVVVIISALVVMYADDFEYKKYVDPSLSLVIVIIIVISTIPLLKESSMVLLQTVPDNFEINDLRERLIKTVPQILDIHEFHLWRLVGDRVICTLHASLKPNINSAEQMQISRRIKDFFHQQGIHSTTVQLETPTNVVLRSDPSEAFISETSSKSKLPSYESSCMLQCPPETDNPDGEEKGQLRECAGSTCCLPKLEDEHHHKSNGHGHSNNGHGHSNGQDNHSVMYTITEDAENENNTKM